jgi:hypothetical protein
MSVFMGVGIELVHALLGAEGKALPHVFASPNRALGINFHATNWISDHSQTSLAKILFKVRPKYIRSERFG